MADVNEGQEAQEQPSAPPEAAPAPAPEAPAAEPAAAAPGDVEEGKVFAILSYALSIIGLPFFLIPLIMRNNAFALYHAKQCLIIWLGGIVVGVLGSLLSFICIGLILLPIGGIILLVLTIMGLINAVNGKAVPVPLIGKWGEDWFKGLQKA